MTLRPPPPSVVTQADQVFDRLQMEITSCRLKPGAKIRINEITLRLEVSAHAVREALSRLSVFGMVNSEAQKGYTVAPVSEADLVDLTKVRVSIEQLCLRRAVEQGGVEWESGIVAAYHRLSRLPVEKSPESSTVNEEWSNAHELFHLALVSACESPALLRIRAGLFAQSERYRRLSFPYRTGTRDPDAEHKALIDAVLERNADHCCGLISHHIWRTAKILLLSPLLIESAK